MSSGRSWWWHHIYQQHWKTLYTNTHTHTYLYTAFLVIWLIMEENQWTDWVGLESLRILIRSQQDNYDCGMENIYYLLRQLSRVVILRLTQIVYMSGLLFQLKCIYVTISPTNLSIKIFTILVRLIRPLPPSHPICWYATSNDGKNWLNKRLERCTICRLVRDFCFIL